MKKLLFILSVLLLNVQQVFAMNVDKFMDEKIAPFSDAVANIIFSPIPVFGTHVPIIIFWILIAGIFFTIYLKGIPVWGFKHACDLLIKPKETGNDKGSGEVSSFQALMTALEGTIG